MDDQTGERDETDRTHDLTTSSTGAGGSRDAGDPTGSGTLGAPPAEGSAATDAVHRDPAPPVRRSPEPVAALPRRSPAIWAIVVALVGVLVLVATVGAHAGALALAGVLAAAGVSRAVTPGAVVGLAVRSRTFDVLFYLLLAAAVVFLTQTTPDI